MVAIFSRLAGVMLACRLLQSPRASMPRLVLVTPPEPDHLAEQLGLPADWEDFSRWQPLRSLERSASLRRGGVWLTRPGSLVRLEPLGGSEQG
jgi:hypothetical protein